MLLSAEHEEYRKVVADFVDREIVPHAMAWEEAAETPRSIVGKLAGIGALGMTIPEEYGGSGGDHMFYALLMEELGRGDSGARGIVSVSLGLVGKTIAKHGDDGQKAYWLPRICSGESLACFGLTEPDSGSDPSALRTRAVRDGEDWVLSGEKVFITNGTWADLCLVFARTGGPGAKGISAFLVPTATAGFSAAPVRGKLGLRAQSTGNLHLDGVRVPDSARMGEEGKGFRIAMSALDAGRVSVAASCVGLARASLEAATEYAKTREQFGKPIASFQLVQELLADIDVETEAARALTWRAAALADAHSPEAGLAASRAKLYASEVALRAASNGLQVFGGAGYVENQPIAKYLRDARAMTLYEGTTQIQKLIIGRALTGINAFV
ncbi:MAG: acyl-CoA dehydrogenase family protein [Sporichthyaceae bacterium]